MAEPWSSIDDVAAHLGVRKDSVYRWIEKHGLPATKVGKLWRLKLSEVDAWMRGRGADGDSAPIVARTNHLERAERGSAPPARVVMVVDDDEMVLMGLQKIMETWGLKVLAAGDMEGVNEHLTQEKPDLILSDLRLRDNLSGFDLIEDVRSRLGPIPAIILTGETSKDVLEEGVRRKMTLLHKPISGQP